MDWHCQPGSAGRRTAITFEPGDYGHEPLGFRVALIPADKGLTAAEPTPTPKQITNSIGMKLTLVPSGEFMMGSKESAEETAASSTRPTARIFGMQTYFKDEHPQHRVRITKPFYLGTYHVTRGQFRQFVADTGYKTDAEKEGTRGLGLEPRYEKVSASTRNTPGGTRASSRRTSTRWCA